HQVFHEMPADEARTPRHETLAHGRLLPSFEDEAMIRVRSELTSPAQATILPGVRVASEALDCVLLRLANPEGLEKLHDLKDVLQLWVDVAENKLPTGPPDALVEGDELAEHQAGQYADAAEVENETARAEVLDELEELFIDGFDDLLLGDFPTAEGHDGD